MHATNQIPSEPVWQALYDTAAAQEGQFTTQQAAAAGYSRPLLNHYEKIGRVARVRRGIYRLVHFPRGEHEELVTAWLWTDSKGIISHQTATAAAPQEAEAQLNAGLDQATLAGDTTLA